MNILINLSNLKVGGGLQVAHSFLYAIKETKVHHFTVVLSLRLEQEVNIDDFDPEYFNFKVYRKKQGPLALLCGKDRFLSQLEAQIKAEVVFSVFGPTYWKSANRHVIGFAKAQYIYSNSPFFQQITLKQRMYLMLKKLIHLRDFRRNSTVLITENADVSERLKKLMPSKQIFTVTNYYNQVFDEPEKWQRDICLPSFKGFTLLTVSADYPHKNLTIIPKVIDYLKQNKREFLFRFVLTLKDLPEAMKSPHLLNLGAVNIRQCPYLYEQADAVFVPTLLECFTATYPEAMRMEKPLLTSDLNFARGLCKNAAFYFDPLNPIDIGEKIYELAQNQIKQEELVKNGIKQLQAYDNYNERSQKYLEIITSQ